MAASTAFWDYGPLGVELKNNLRDLWWKAMVTCPPIGPGHGNPVEIVGLDSSIIQNPKAWEASGHVGGFSDPMVDDKETKLRYRADHLYVLQTERRQGQMAGAAWKMRKPRMLRSASRKRVGGKSSADQYESAAIYSIDKRRLIREYHRSLIRKHRAH
jgi:glycyl-tRNA synthetase (class II)